MYLSSQRSPLLPGLQPLAMGDYASMKTLKRYILAINGDSSSVQFGLYSLAEPLQGVLHGKMDRIGLSRANLIFIDAAGQRQLLFGIAAADYKSATNFL